MISFYPVTLEEVLTYEGVDEVFESLRIDGVERGHILSSLKDASLMKVVDEEGKGLGFLSVTPYGDDGVEVHAYLLPKCRNRSKSVLRAFKEAVFTLTPFTTIRTSVTGVFRPLVRFLSFIGFRLVGVKHDAFTKDGISYPMYFLEMNKGD